ncbi:MAG: putative tellurite resistance protein B-like protein [Patiriisocius sp.]|jgi:uncharacterized tellurite resistance protein B-like protein
MLDKERLIDKFGELLYVIAKADGVIQNEEKEALLALLEDHEWSKEIKWSFDYAQENDVNVEKTYKAVIDFCHDYGPAPEYTEFILAMQKIADAAKGAEESENVMINSFSSELIARFQKDLDELNSKASQE